MLKGDGNGNPSIGEEEGSRIVCCSEVAVFRRRRPSRTVGFELAALVPMAEATIADWWLAQDEAMARTASTSLSSEAAASPSAGEGGNSSRRAA